MYNCTVLKATCWLRLTVAPEQMQGAPLLFMSLKTCASINVQRQYGNNDVCVMRFVIWTYNMSANRESLHISKLVSYCCLHTLASDFEDNQWHGALTFSKGSVLSPNHNVMFHFGRLWRVISKRLWWRWKWRTSAGCWWKPTTKRTWCVSRIICISVDMARVDMGCKHSLDFTKIHDQNDI